MKLNKLFKLFRILGALSLVCVYATTAYGATQQKTTQQKTNEQKTTEQKNSVILFIGDGMGYPQISLARAYNGVANKNPSLKMDPMLIGAAGTRASQNATEHLSGLVTDSAAAATALGTGHRTYNGAIGIALADNGPRPVASFLYAAQLAGKYTGVVTTTRVTHATPAAFIAHARDRHNENIVAEQYLDSGVNIIFGGGECQFVARANQAEFGKACREDNKNLKQALKDRGYKVVYNNYDLARVNGDKVLGLFDSSHVPFVKDRGANVPSLLAQTQNAVRLLENSPKGFVLMVEGGRIDHAAHTNDAASMVNEVLEFDAVLAWAKNYVDAHPNVAIVATADHETGGLTLGHNTVYDYYPQVLQKVAHSSEFVAPALNAAKTDADFKAIMQQQAGISDLKDSELKMLREGLDAQGRPAAPGREGAFNAIISERAGLGWTTYGHTGVDVPLYAYGKIKNSFTGRIINTDIADQIAKFLQVDMVAATARLNARTAVPQS